MNGIISMNKPLAHACAATALGIAVFFGTLAGTFLMLGGISFVINTPIKAVGFLLSMLLPLITPWFAVNWAKTRFQLSLEYPENAAGGMMIGLGLLWWWSLALLMAAEYDKPLTQIKVVLALFWALLPSMASMAVCGVSACYARKNIGFLLLALSPFVGAGSLVLLLSFGRTFGR